MKTLIYLCVLGAFCLPLQRVCAREKSQEKTKSEERTRPGIPIKVQIVLSEYDGDKKISSMPYSFVTLADDFGELTILVCEPEFAFPSRLTAKTRKPHTWTLD
jgi:hypothetical protein